MAWNSAEAAEVDIVLMGGTIVDGTGKPGYVGDVAIHDGRIVGVGQLDNIEANWSINCQGLVVCPGFIDLHNHSDVQIVAPETRAAVNFVTQGCTTMVTGNCGSGPIRVKEYYDKIDASGAGTNIAHLVPQGALRREAIGTGLGAPTEQQMRQMLEDTELAMREGAWGMSTGLIYVPSSYASTEELIEIARVVSQYGGIYASHIRGEGKGLLESVDEALRIGREAELPVHVSHFKSSGRDSWGLVRVAARRIQAARDQGAVVTADQYPYIASSTSLDATLLPSQARAGGREELIKRLDDPESGPVLRAQVQRAIELRADGDAVRIARYRPRRDWVGRSLLEIARDENRTAVEIACEVFRNGGAQIVNFSINEEDVRHVMAIDWVATASDGRAYLPGADRPHPRNYGTFPRKIGHYALSEKVVTLEQAIRSSTSLPADILGLTDRGRIATDLVADVTVFDPQGFRDAATFEDPHQYSVGIRYVLVNGQPALVDGHPTGALAGRALRHAAPDKSE